MRLRARRKTVQGSPGHRVAIFLGCCLAFGAVSGAAERPTARLHFDFAHLENGHAQDLSGLKHVGRLEGKDGQLPVTVDTPYGPALKLEKGKGQGVRIPFADDLACTEGLTVMAWVKPEFARAHLAIVANKSDRVPGRPAQGYRLSVFWNRVMMELGFGDEQGERLSSPEWSIEAGFWTHVAMTFDGRRMRLFINSAEAAAKDLPEPRRLAVRPGGFTIGKYFWNDAYPFVGLVGEVQIFPRALSGEDVFREACRFPQPPP